MSYFGALDGLFYAAPTLRLGRRSLFAALSFDACTVRSGRRSLSAAPSVSGAPAESVGRVGGIGGGGSVGAVRACRSPIAVSRSLSTAWTYRMVVFRFACPRSFWTLRTFARARQSAV